MDPAGVTGDHVFAANRRGNWRAFRDFVGAFVKGPLAATVLSCSASQKPENDHVPQVDFLSPQ